MNLGPDHFRHLWKTRLALKERFDKHRVGITRATKKVVGTLETAAAAAAGGIIQGRAGEDGSHVLGVPTDLGLGLALNFLGHFGAAGDYSDHLNHLGDGFLASFTSSVGFGWGTAWRQNGKFSFHKHPAGLPPGGGPGLPPGTAVKGEISPAQMADIVARVRAAAGHPM